MFTNEAQASTHTLLLAAISAANTAAATTATYIDVRQMEGDCVVVIAVGAITGSCTPSVADATDTSGTGTAPITVTEGAFTALVANTPRKYTFRAKSTRGFIGFIGTIVTGPVLIGVTMLAGPKNT